MEIITGILGFLQIANLVISLKDKLSVSNDEKNATSDILVNIGNLLMSVTDDLEKNIYPHGKCSQMEVYAEQLKVIVKDKLNETEYTKLQETLNESLKVEKLLGELNLVTEEQRKNNIICLKTASGKFIALGQIMKIK